MGGGAWPFLVGGAPQTTIEIEKLNTTKMETHPRDKISIKLP